MECTVIPLLENRASVTNKAIVLWNAPDIRYRMRECFFQLILRKNGWQVIENDVIKRAQEIPDLSNEQRDELVSIIRSIGQEIKVWMEYHVQNEYLGLELPERFSWTSEGRIDNKRTAEEMIIEKGRDLSRKYKIACVYCLEGHIRKVWEILSDECKYSIWCESDSTVLGLKELVKFWIYDSSIINLETMGEMRRVINQRYELSLHRYAFETAALAANKTATEYMLKYLPPEEKSISFQRCAIELKRRLFSRYKELPEEYYSDVLCFIFSVMDSRDKRTFLISNSYDALQCFLSWPRQHLFLESIHLVWNCVPYETYSLLWSVFQFKLTAGEKDYDYWTLFEHFWRQSLKAHKESTIMKCCENPDFLISLCTMENNGMLNLILRDSSKEQRVNIFFRNFKLWYELIFINKLDTFELLIQKCLLTRDGKEFFKRQFVKDINLHRTDEEIKSGVWFKALQLVSKYV